MANLICSDGLTGLVALDVLEEILNQYPRRTSAYSEEMP